MTLAAAGGGRWKVLYVESGRYTESSRHPHEVPSLCETARNKGGGVHVIARGRGRGVQSPGQTPGNKSGRLGSGVVSTSGFVHDGRVDYPMRT